MSLTEAQRADIEQRVDEGVYFLDHVVPGWAYKVDLSKLDLRAEHHSHGQCGCIVMQVTGEDYLAGRELIGLGMYSGWGSGFVVGDDELEYAHELWTEAVLERRPNVLVGGERVPA